MKFKYILLSFLVFACISCEQDVTDVNLPFEEKIVINGILEANTSIKKIYLSKTLPPLENSTFEKTCLTNAVAYLEVNNIKYSLKYLPNEKYYYTNEYIPKVGDKVKINVDWNGHNAYAETFIPKAITDVRDITLDSSKMRDNYGYTYRILKISGKIYTDENSIVSTGLLIFDTYSDYLTYPIYANNDASIPIYVDDWYSYYYPIDKLYIINYDPAFYPYYQSRHEGNFSDDIFSISGNNIVWNVKGEGLGIFIGMNKKIIPLNL